MADSKAKRSPVQRKVKTLDGEIVKRIIDDHESRIDDNMGHLYNRFVGYISEAQIPLPQVITVLNMLLRDALGLAEQKYKG
jgi:hypothetical protein